METVAAFFRDGGLFIWLILVVSVIGLAIIVERVFYLYFWYNVNGRAVWAKISVFLQEGKIKQAKELCQGSRVPLIKILDQGISVANEHDKDIQNAVDEAAMEIMPAVEKRLPYIATLANISTLLGLLGTIQGLIQAFSAVGMAEPSQKAALLASGISISLYTTAFGISVAVPMLGLHTVLQARAHKIIDEIDEFSVKLLNLLHRMKRGTKAE